MNNKKFSLKLWSRYTISNSLAYIALIFVALALVANCKSREVGSSASSLSAASVQGLSGGKLLFEDDFSRAELGESWHRGTGEGGKGQWAIREGGVEGSVIRNDPLWLTVPLPDAIRVEFEAQALTDVGDLKVEIFGDGETHASGYVLIFGGWNNQLDVIARLDEHGKDRKEQATRGVETKRVYKMAIVRAADGVLRWYVDGEVFMTYEDSSPLVGDGHRYFALANWNAPVRFSNVRVYGLDDD